MTVDLPRNTAAWLLSPDTKIKFPTHPNLNKLLYIYKTWVCLGMEQLLCNKWICVGTPHGTKRNINYTANLLTSILFVYIICLTQPEAQQGSEVSESVFFFRLVLSPALFPHTGSIFQTKPSHPPFLSVCFGFFLRSRYRP